MPTKKKNVYLLLNNLKLAEENEKEKARKDKNRNDNRRKKKLWQ